MTRKLRLLLVEDSEDDAVLVVRALTRGGFDVRSQRVDRAADLDAALAEGWDIVISDHSLPGFSSTAALAIVRRRFPSLPFIIVSGTIGEDEAVRAIKAGAQDYLLKDKLGRLASAVERELAEEETRRGRRLAEAKQRQAEQRHRELVETIPAVTYVAMVGDEHRMTYVSPQIEALTGVPPEEWTGAPGIWAEHVADADRERVLAVFRGSTPGERVDCEYRMRRRDGGVVWLRDSATVLTREAGGVLVRGFAIDITEQKRGQETIRRLAYVDTLTGFPNRVALEEALAEELKESRAANEPLAVLLVRVERFDEINRTLGHPTGDRLLRGVAARLTRLEAASVARLEGAQFAVVLPGHDALAARQAAAGVRDVLAAPYVFEDVTVEAGARIGIALAPGHGDTPAALLRRADIALHAAGTSAGGYAVYASESDAFSLARLAIVGDLRRAIETDGLTLAYQPKMCLRSRRPVGVEVLVRWQHPARGDVSPADFVPVAEETGLVRPLTRWVLAAAIKQCRAWANAGVEMPIAVNISAHDLLDGALPDRAASLLETWGVPAERLTLEITETSVMSDPVAAMEALQRLRSRGIHIALDDFGTGYSSLGQVQRLPLDELKIDRSLVNGGGADGARGRLARFVVDLGHSLGLTVVAEGIEDAVTLERLASHGCDAAQGFHISAPVPADAVVAWLRDDERRVA